MSIARYNPIAKPAPVVAKGPRKAETYRAARRNAARGNRPVKPKGERLVMRQIERKE